MTHNSSGLTITFPPFDPNTDKLFQAIRSFIEIKHEDVERRLQRIETRQQKMLTTMGTMEQLMTAAINAAAAAAATAATLNRVAGSMSASSACVQRTNCVPSRVNVVEPVRVLPSPNVVASSAFDSINVSMSSHVMPTPSPTSVSSNSRMDPLNSMPSVDLRAAPTNLDSLPTHPKLEANSRYSMSSPDRPVSSDFDFPDSGSLGPTSLYNVLRNSGALLGNGDTSRVISEAHKTPQRSHFSATMRNLFSGPSVPPDTLGNGGVSLTEDMRRGGSNKTSISSNGESSAGSGRSDHSNSIMGDIANLPSLQTSSIGTQMRVIFDRDDKRYIWLGGHQSVRLPLWAYVKCLETTRGMPDELGPRISLRMLQALFGKQYMLTHNYSGTNGKAPIDRDVLNAVLDQALLQFGSDHFYKDATCLSKFRDYINNAFRVVAYRDRKGVSVTCPFWDASGQPMTEFFLLKSADLIRRLRLDQYDALGTTLPLPSDSSDDGPPVLKRSRNCSATENVGPNSEPPHQLNSSGVDLYTAVSFPVTTIDSFSVRETEESPVSIEDNDAATGGRAPAMSVSRVSPECPSDTTNGTTDIARRSSSQ